MLLSEKETQTKAILAYLRRGERLTPVKALQLFQCFRLAARIWDIKNSGIEVQSELVSGNGKKWSEYYINEVNEKSEA